MASFRATVAATALAATPVTGCSSDQSPQSNVSNVTDVHFIAMMTPHHQQAVDMSDIILAKHHLSPATKDLAQRIKNGQQEEIDFMKGLAAAWGEEEMMAQHAQHIANGMIIPSELEQLRVMDGPEAEKTFLKLMHSHHEGAILMTQDEVQNGHHQPLKDAARKMIDVQTAEMKEMETLLN